MHVWWYCFILITLIPIDNHAAGAAWRFSCPTANAREAIAACTKASKPPWAPLCMSTLMKVDKGPRAAYLVSSGPARKFWAETQTSSLLTSMGVNNFLRKARQLSDHPNHVKVFLLINCKPSQANAFSFSKL